MDSQRQKHEKHLGLFGIGWRSTMQRLIYYVLFFIAVITSGREE